MKRQIQRSCKSNGTHLKILQPREYSAASFPLTPPTPLAVTIQLEKTLALTPAQGVSIFRRDFVRSPGEREKLSSASDNLTFGDSSQRGRMEFPLLGERARVRASQFSNCIIPAWGEDATVPGPLLESSLWFSNAASPVPSVPRPWERERVVPQSRDRVRAVGRKHFDAERVRVRGSQRWKCSG
jgi:hypothetical protein